jgi:DNA mismatch repair protein MutL
MDAAAPIGAIAWPRAPLFEAGTPVGIEALRPVEREEPGFLARSESVAVMDEPAPQQALDVPALLQLRRTYILVEHAEGIVLIDQHSAHERVLFEKFMGTLERGDAPSQKLLFPLTLHLSSAEAEAFESDREILARLGFEIEGFGGNTLAVSAVPMPHPRFDAERCLRDTLAALAGDRSPASAKRHEHLAATVACKAAIKAGQELSSSEMRALFIALRDTTLPAHDVHGRSTIVQVSWDELERRFGRR